MNKGIPDLLPPSSRRRKIMLASQFEEERIVLKWHTEYLIVQPKLDGLRCRVEIGPNKLSLKSSEDEPITTVPHIADDLISLCSLLEEGQEIELDGELYTHGMSLNEIQSLVSSNKNLKNTSKIQLHLFDVIALEEMKTRVAILRSLIIPSDNIKLVPTIIIKSSVEDIFSFLDSCMSTGYEGIIVRHPNALYERKRSRWMMKYKPHQQDDYIIVGYSQEIDKDGNLKPDSLGRLICTADLRYDESLTGFFTPKSSLPPTFFGVGSGLTDSDRKELWRHREELIGRRVTIKYQSISPKGKVPRHGVYKSIVEE